MVSPLIRLTGYARKYHGLQAGIAALQLASSPLALINPYLAKLIIDKAYGNRDIKLFFILASASVIVFILHGAMTAFSGYLSKRINYAINLDLTRDLFKSFIRLPVGRFNERPAAERLHRIASDAQRVSRFLSQAFQRVAGLFPRFLLTLVIIFFLDRRLALFAAFMMPVSFIHPYVFGRLLQKITGRMMENLQRVFERLHAVLSHMYLVKAFGREEDELEKFEGVLLARKRAELRNAKFLSLSTFFSSILNKVIGSIIALYGGYQVIRGAMTLGTLTAVMIYVAQLIGLAKSTSGLCEDIAINSVSCRRLSEILDLRPIPTEMPGAIDHVVRRGNIEFKDVRFRYGQDRYVLDGITFSTAPTAKIALTGPSGCGKTTLLSLILRLYEASGGSIFIDGLDIRGIRSKSLASQTGIAPQEPFLWNDTVANNILYGAEARKEKVDIIKAAKIAEAHKFIMKLPKGYNSAIGEMGCRISEGQKQRIAIARAVIKRPKILMLDEALSSVDSEAELRIIDNIMREFGNSTVAVVSHRLSTVRRMNLVYFLAGPSRMECGTHEELLGRNAGYRQLFAGQIKKFKGSVAHEAV